MNTAGYIKKLERDIKKLEIRTMLTDSKAEQAKISKMIKDKECRLNDLARKVYRDAFHGCETTSFRFGDLVCR